jgi:hypothetical protein
MKTYDEMVREDRRLTILLLLVKTPGYRSNEHLLQTALDAWGHTVSQDLLRTELGWLKEQGYVEIQDIGGVQIVTLTMRGADVATGKVEVAGIKRPSPG